LLGVERGLTPGIAPVFQQCFRRKRAGAFAGDLVEDTAEIGAVEFGPVTADAIGSIRLLGGRGKLGW
jgi:hypothetical protein